jgi:hypothetical protein
VDPLTIGLILQGLGTGWGAYSQNRANKKTERTMQQRQGQLEQLIMPMLGQNRQQGGAESSLLELLSGMGDMDLFGSGNQAWNTGQDSLMQMLRSDPLDTSEMFKSWEPIENRALQEALAGAFSQAPGLGQRFGSAMRREEGQVRGEAAENSAARRQTAELGVQGDNRQRQLQAAELLSGMGGQQAGTLLQMLMGQIQGYGMAGNMGANRQNNDLGLLSLLFGQPMMAGQPNAMPGALGEMGGMLALLPLLQQLSAGNKPTTTVTGGP